MIKTNLRKTTSFIFLQSLLLSVFLSGSSTLFHLSQNALLGKQLGFSQIPALKVSTILPQIILVLTLLIFSIYKPFEKVFRGILITLIGIISLITGLMFFQGHLELKGVPETLGIYKPLVTHWPISLMYIVLNLLSFNLFALLIWGFINRLVTSSEGMKYYIPLALVLGLAGAVITNLGLMLMGASSWPLMAIVIPAIVLMACSLVIFNWSWQRLPDSLTHPEKPSPASHTRFPFLSGAYLLAGCVMVKSLLDILFKSQLRTQFPDPTSYSKFMGYYSISVGSSTLVISIIWAVLGTWLISKKGWKTTALYASLSVLVGGIVFLSLSVSESVSWLNQGIFTGLLTGTTNALFFPLIQILYLYMPYQTRLRTKIATEMIALPLMKWIPSLATQGLLIVFGSITAITLYLKILVPILVVLLVIANRRASSKFSDRFSGGMN